MRRCSRARGQRGIALILALWLTVMLTVIASGFAFSMRSEALAARNMISLAQARAAANGAIERTVFELSRPSTPDTWKRDGVTHAWKEGDIAITASATDEAAKIDLNTANEVLLRNFFSTVGGADPDVAAQITDAIQDWRDPDDLKRPNGAEEADYRAAGLTYKPANAPFETVTELARVMGVTPAIYARVADSLTVFSGQPGINPLTASRNVLLALPAATPPVVDMYLQVRSEALKSNLPIPPFPPAQGFTAGAGLRWRIRAVATTPDGVTFAREAVVSPSGDPRRPLIALAWLDQITPLPYGTDSQDAADKEKNNGRP
jgi:general secretion pathway protein K